MDSSIYPNSTVIGRFGESLAEQALTNAGYNVIDHNWRGSVGEIDLVAIQNDYLIFVEVKVRKSLKFGSPEESITRSKQRRINHTALEYLFKTAQQEKPWRVDIVAIELSSTNKVVRLSHYIGVDVG